MCSRGTASFPASFSWLSCRSCLSRPSCLRLLHEIGDSIELVVRELRALAAQQRGDRALGGAVEECVDEMPQRGPARGAAWHGRRVDVAQPVLLVADVPFLLEHAQLGAHRRVIRVAGQIRHDLAGGRASAAIEDVHDLAFAPCERAVGGVVGGFCHWCYFYSRRATSITPPRRRCQAGTFLREVPRVPRVQKMPPEPLEPVEPLAP